MKSKYQSFACVCTWHLIIYVEEKNKRNSDGWNMIWISHWRCYRVLKDNLSMIIKGGKQKHGGRNTHTSSSVAQSCPSLCDAMNHSTPGLPVHHQLPESTQTHVHWVADAIQPSHPLSSPSPPALNLSQHQCLFKWVSSPHQAAKVLEFQLQHQSFQWTPRTDLL